MGGLPVVVDVVGVVSIEVTCVTVVDEGKLSVKEKIVFKTFLHFTVINLT